MELKQTLRIGLATLAIAGACAFVAPRSLAQGGPGGFQMPPEMAAKIKAWQKWRESHKNISNLGLMVYQLQELQKDEANKLNKQQASKVLAAIKPWQTKPTMTDEQAKGVMKQIGASLNEKQMKKMTTFQPPWARRGGGGGGFGGGRPGGGGGGPRPGGGPGGGFTMPDPKDYNPLNPDTLPFEGMRPMVKKNMSDFVSSLEKAK